MNSEARRTGFSLRREYLCPLGRGSDRTGKPSRWKRPAQGKQPLSFSVRPAGAPVEIEASAGGSTGASTGLDFAIIFGSTGGPKRPERDRRRIHAGRRIRSRHGLSRRNHRGARASASWGERTHGLKAPAQLNPETGLQSGRKRLVDLNHGRLQRRNWRRIPSRTAGSNRAVNSE